MVIDCWIGPRAAHLMGRAKKRLWERLVRTVTSRSLLPCGMRQWRQVLQGCSRLPSPAVHAPLRASRCCRAAVFFQKHKAHHTVPPGHSCSIPGDPARLEPGLTQASQREKAQYLRRRRGQLKFNVQANTSSPPLNQGAAIPNGK